MLSLRRHAAGKDDNQWHEDDGEDHFLRRLVRPLLLAVLKDCGTFSCTFSVKRAY